MMKIFQNSNETLEKCSNWSRVFSIWAVGYPKERLSWNLVYYTSNRLLTLQLQYVTTWLAERRERKEWQGDLQTSQNDDGNIATETAHTDHTAAATFSTHTPITNTRTDIIAQADVTVREKSKNEFWNDFISLIINAMKVEQSLNIYE